MTAPLSPFQARRFADRFRAIVLNGYGQAEMGEVIGWTAADAKAHPEKLGAAGRPHPGVSARIDNPDANGVGELLVRPPWCGTTPDGPCWPTGSPTTTTFAPAIWPASTTTGMCGSRAGRGDVINRGGNKVVPTEVRKCSPHCPR